MVAPWSAAKVMRAMFGVVCPFSTLTTAVEVLPASKRFKSWSCCGAGNGFGFGADRPQVVPQAAS